MVLLVILGVYLLILVIDNLFFQGTATSIFADFAPSILAICAIYTLVFWKKTFSLDIETKRKLLTLKYQLKLHQLAFCLYSIDQGLEVKHDEATGSNRGFFVEKSSFNCVKEVKSFVLELEMIIPEIATYIAQEKNNFNEMSEAISAFSSLQFTCGNILLNPEYLLSFDEGNKFNAVYEFLAKYCNVEKAEIEEAFHN